MRTMPFSMPCNTSKGLEGFGRAGCACGCAMMKEGFIGRLIVLELEALVSVAIEAASDVLRRLQCINFFDLDKWISASDIHLGEMTECLHRKPCAR